MSDPQERTDQNQDQFAGQLSRRRAPKTYAPPALIAIGIAKNTAIGASGSAISDTKKGTTGSAKDDKPKDDKPKKTK